MSSTKNFPPTAFTSTPLNDSDQLHPAQPSSSSSSLRRLHVCDISENGIEPRTSGGDSGRSLAVGCPHSNKMLNAIGENANDHCVLERKCPPLLAPPSRHLQLIPSNIPMEIEEAAGCNEHVSVPNTTGLMCTDEILGGRCILNVRNHDSNIYGCVTAREESTESCEGEERQLIPRKPENEGSSTLNTSLLPANNSNVPSSRFSFFIGQQGQLKKKKLLIFVAMLLLTSVGTVFVEHSLNPPSKNQDDPTLPSWVLRMDHTAACISKLSCLNNNRSLAVDSPQTLALEWFLFGKGRNISVPSLEECTWKHRSIFVVFYSLIVVRNALNITFASWHDEGENNMDISTVCHHWKRVTCNSEQTEIVKLHLSNSDLNGFIPPEIAGFQSLSRLELYGNQGIWGQLPQEMGNMPKLEYLHLHNTSIGGIVPSTFGNMLYLHEFFLDRTMVEGKMPDEVCKLHEKGLLMSLHADCGGTDPRVKCEYPTCCTACHDASHQR